MSFLQNLLGRAKGILSRPQEPIQATDAIKHDRFDAQMFSELLDEVPALRDLAEDLNQHYNYTEDMVRDTLMEFWQVDPQLREVNEMKAGWETNQAVQTDIRQAPEYEELRTNTLHDRYGATMATIGVSQRIREFLKENEEAQEAAEEAAKAQQEQEQALQGAVQAVADAEAQGWPEIGPPSPAQQAAAQALAEALDAADAADAAMAQAQQQAQQAAQEAKAALQTPVREAIKETQAKLEEEHELFSAWGVEPGELKMLSFQERADLAARLRGGRLGDWSHLIGRFRLDAAAQQTKKVEYGRDEVVGVEVSGRLPDIIPSELVHLALPRLRRQFYVRMVEEQLLTRQFIGTEKVGRGAIIACVDCSGSMELTDENGIPREAWAKAIALALLDQARREGRDFVGINFSSSGQQKMWKFPKGSNDLDGVLEFIEHFFNGGTNFEVPLLMATDVLEGEFNQDGKMKGDIVFITDDDCSVSQDGMAKFNARKARLGFRVFGLAVGVGYGQALEGFSDNVRSVTEFASPETIRDMMRVV